MIFVAGFVVLACSVAYAVFLYKSRQRRLNTAANSNLVFVQPAVAKANARPAAVEGATGTATALLVRRNSITGDATAAAFTVHQRIPFPPSGPQLGSNRADGLTSNVVGNSGIANNGTTTRTSALGLPLPSASAKAVFAPAGGAAAAAAAAAAIGGGGTAGNEERTLAQSCSLGSSRSLGAALASRLSVAGWQKVRND
ncbi:hypothetical protein Vafri_8196 [Volvox africanus]|nr:hypothetical protein Vafri_8196 [Volvox africanus]